MTQVQTYIPSQYTHLANLYNQNEFTQVQKLLRNLSSNCLYNAKYPILKLLRAVCRKMLINEFESVFFAFVVQTNRWNIQDNVIQKYSSQVRDIVCYTTDNPQYKSITLYLLLCSYTVKFYLNEEVDIYLHEMIKICPDFKLIFQTWAKQYAQTTLKINPKNLNKVYKSVFLHAQQVTSQYNYNELVDNLIQISPAYNPEKDKDKKDQQQLKRRMEQQSKEQQASMISTSNLILNSTSIANLKILSNSGYLQKIIPLGGSTVSSGFGINTGILNASYFGLNQSINEYDTIRDVTLGFKIAQSDCEQGVDNFIDHQKTTNLNLRESELSELPFRKNISTFSNLQGFFK